MSVEVEMLVVERLVAVVIVVVEWFKLEGHDVSLCDTAADQHHCLLLQADTLHLQLLVSFFMKIQVKSWIL